MNERKLRLLFERTLLITTPLVVSLGSAACGGATVPYDYTGGGSGGSGADGGTAGKGGAAGAAGKGGSAGSGAGAGNGGAGAVGGSGASGGFGAVAGSAGAGAGGAGGAGAAAGAGGAGGEGGACSAPPKSCFDTVTVQLPIDCIDDPTVPPDAAECTALCPTINGGVSGGCNVTDQGGEAIMLTCNPTCFVGRRTASFVNEPRSGADLGSYFAGVAELEAASVFAFRDLRSELRALGAPKRLLAALGRAARDETRHARSTRALARRYGGRVQPAPRTRAGARALEDIAAENVREGCVRETFGALVAHQHASEARDPVVRATLRRIARDETRHAAASFAVQHWLESRLDAGARARVRAAREAAIEELSAELELPPPPDPEARAGFPDVSRARALLGELERSLWKRG